MYMYVYVCVCACVHAYAYACVCACSAYIASTPLFLKYIPGAPCWFGAGWVLLLEVRVGGVAGAVVVLVGLGAPP